MRIDGWKAIANYLGRDRSTVMRWAAERAMPVHRIPGGQRGSVFALSEELDAWLAVRAAQADEGAADLEVIPASTPAEERRRWWRGRQGRGRRVRTWMLWLIAPAALLASLGAVALQNSPQDEPRQSLPQDPTAAALFLEARADWAQRNPASIATAIAKLQQVVIREPGFAPAYAALADCHLLSHEFGSAAPAEAYGRAQNAIDAALRIDPGNAAAWRAKGFLDYWWRRDPSAARVSFEKSLAVQADDAQTRFWYGNVLIDNGDFAAGLEQLDKARLLDPASTALQADYA
jgi:tetratricopeptide (TPR) repeat protein